MVQLLSQEDNFSKLIIADEIHTACYYSNGCRTANIPHRGSTAPPKAGVSSQFTFFSWRSGRNTLTAKQPIIPGHSRVEAMIFSLHSPLGWK